MDAGGYITLVICLCLLHQHSSVENIPTSTSDWLTWPKQQRIQRTFGWHPPQEPLSPVVQQRLQAKTGTLTSSQCCGAAGARRRRRAASNSSADTQDSWQKGDNGKQSNWRIGATSGEFPWAAALVLIGQSTPLCGGAVINDRYVLTSAWCALLATSGAQLLLGEYNLEATSGNEMRKTISVIKIHPLYSRVFGQYDIALILFTTPLVLSTTSVIKPVCLPDRAYFILLGFLTVTGWGTTYQAGPIYQVLQKNQVIIPPIMPYCEWYIPPFFNWFIRSTVFCGTRSVFIIIARENSTGITQQSLTDNQIITQQSPTDNQRITQQSPTDNQRITQQSPTDNQRITQQSPTDNQRITQQSPTDNQRITQQSPTGNQRITQQSPTDNQRITQQSSTDNQRITQQSPTDNQRITQQSPADNQRIPLQSPTDNQRITQQSPTDNQRITQQSPTDNQRITQQYTADSRKSTSPDKKPRTFGFNTCNGDLGSPLMSYLGARYEATAIVVGGSACSPFTPGYYFHVGYAYTWIISSTSDATYC